MGIRPALAGFPRGCGNGGKPAFGFPRFPQPRHFHSSLLRLAPLILRGLLQAIAFPREFDCRRSLLRIEKAEELAAGGFEGSLLLFGIAMVQERPAFLQNTEDEFLHRHFAELGSIVQLPDDFSP